MGYKVEHPVYKLKFADDDKYAGVEVCVRGVSLGKLLKLGKLMSKQEMADMIESIEDDVLVAFENALVSWNLEDEDDKPLPISRESLENLPIELAFTLISEWIEVMGNVAAPLKKNSGDGSTSPEVSIPMAAL